jgi:hypothetical protein
VGQLPAACWGRRCGQLRMDYMVGVPHLSLHWHQPVTGLAWCQKRWALTLLLRRGSLDIQKTVLAGLGIT